MAKEHRRRLHSSQGRRVFHDCKTGDIEWQLEREVCDSDVIQLGEGMVESSQAGMTTKFQCLHAVPTEIPKDA